MTHREILDKIENLSHCKCLCEIQHAIYKANFYREVDPGILICRCECHFEENGKTQETET